jgi:transcriptional regulator with XRE-family HTH domain
MTHNPRVAPKERGAVMERADIPMNRETGVTGRRISELRNQRGWSQQELADRIARESAPISRSTIAKLESGVRGRLRVREAEAFARAFGLSLAGLAGSGPLVFISYAQADLHWAQWIDHQLKGAAYRTILQDTQFLAGPDAVRAADEGLHQAELVVCVLSRDYLRSRAGDHAWQAVYAGALSGQGRSGVLPVRVEDCPVDGPLAALAYVDLARVSDQEAAHSLLLAHIAQSRAGLAAPGLPPHYPGAYPGHSAAAIPARALETDFPPEQTRDLLVQEVTRTRHPDARIVQCPGAFPHVLVSYSHGAAVEQFRIGTYVGQVTEDVLDDFAGHVRDADPLTPAELVYQGPPPTEAVEHEAARRRVRLRSIDDFRGLIDLRPFVRRQTERLAEDHDYAPRRYVPQRFRDVSASPAKVERDLAEHLVSRLREDEGGFTLVLGDFGAGKTFALREVARRLAAYSDLIPIYVELRTLDRAFNVESLVSSHLANHRHPRIDLDAFAELLRAGRVVLLFDGFDELVTRVTYDRAADHLRRLLAAAQGRAKIVVASRTQHFKSDRQVRTVLGERVGGRAAQRMLTIEPFDADQIRSYLTRHYNDDATRAEDRIEAMGRINDLSALSANPRMLGFIAALDDVQLKAAADAPVRSGAALYEQVLDHWLACEVERTSGISGAPPGLSRPQLWRAVTVLALRLWESGRSRLSLDELGEIGRSFACLPDLGLSAEQTVHAVGAGSLLIRSADDRFGFIHASVMEWLLAKRIAEEWAAGTAEPALLAGEPLPDTVLEFLCELAGAGRALSWVDGVLTDPAADPARRTNALHLSGRLKATDGDSTVHARDLSGDELLRELAAREPGGSIYRITFSADSPRPADTHEDDVVQVWDAATGELLAELTVDRR